MSSTAKGQGRRASSRSTVTFCRSNRRLVRRPRARRRGRDARARSPAVQLNARFELDALDALEVTACPRQRRNRRHFPAGTTDPAEPARSAHHGRRLHRGAAGQVPIRRARAREQVLLDLAVQGIQELRERVGAIHASTQSGADQPSYSASCNQYARVQTCCSDSAAQGTTPRMATTAFGATFCSYNIQRLVTVDTALVLRRRRRSPTGTRSWSSSIRRFTAAAAEMSSVISTNTLSVEVAQHEFGHSFMRLGDEYTRQTPAIRRAATSREAAMRASRTSPIRPRAR